MRGAWTAAVVALALTGCGGGGDDKSVSASVVVHAAAKTSAAGTARVSTTFTGFRHGKRIEIGARNGFADSARRRGFVDFDYTGAVSNPDSRKAEALRGQVLYDGDSFYVHTYPLIWRLPIPKEWLKLPRDRMADVTGAGRGISALGALDATRPVDYLRAARGKAEEMGGGTVYGAPTKRYRVEVDYRSYVPMAAARDRVGIGRNVDQIEQSFGTTRFPVDVWIARDGTIRRVRGEVRKRAVTIVYTLDLAGIGKPQPLRLPEPATVGSVKDIQARSSGG